ncbi:major capsid protein [Tsukamurella ocularis]|uniref:major capsid protein n=1 Tax=Tsukamurella ocularis TaxID=1970234 RepID=UPI0039EE4CF4
MAIVYDGPVTPDNLTTFMRTVPLPADNALSAMFATRNVNSNKIDFAELTRTNRTARYRSFDGTIHVSGRDAGSGKYVELAPFSDSLNKGEYERIQEEIAKLGQTDAASPAVIAAIYNDAERLVNTMQNRVELAWGDVLTDGKLTINEGGLTSEADYGVPANQVTAPAALWSDTVNAKPLTDLDAWQQVRTTNGNGAAATLLTSRKVGQTLRRNKEVIDAIYGSTQGRTLISMNEVNSFLAGEGLPTVTTYDTALDVDGVVTRVIPENKAILLPADLSSLGYMVYGISATALELVKSAKADFTFGDASGIVGVVEKVGPPYREFTFVDAVGMPVLSDARKLSVATVIA